MQPYDFAMLAVLIGATLIGAWKGLAWQMASLASLVVSYFVALKYCDQLAPFLTDQAPLNRYLAMLIIYALCSASIWMLFRLVAGFLDKLKLKDYDRQMGALMGAAKGILLCVVITFFALGFTEGKPSQASIRSSNSSYCIGYLIDRAEPVMPVALTQLFGPQLDQLHDQLEHDHVDVHGGHHQEDKAAPVPASIEGEPHHEH